MLLPQAELTLNLLRQSSLNPQLSAWEYFNGPFDFNKTPLGSVGCRVLIHAKPATRRSWDFRAKEGFYIGPALDSYHCFKLVQMDTKSQVILDTVEFRHAYRQIPALDYYDIPVHKRKEICHTLVVCKVRPEKDDPDRTRITIGGSRICYPGDVGTNTASLELVKILLNSVLSRKGARFSTIDLKNFYLDTPMPDPKYVRNKMSDIPEEFIIEYNLHSQDCDGWIYFEICQGCYGLPQ